MALRRLRKDDTVMVIAGRERGKTGKVLRVLDEKERVVIEHVNMVKRHQKPRSAQQQGGIVEKEAPIHLSNVVPICTRCNKPTRVAMPAARNRSWALRASNSVMPAATIVNRSSPLCRTTLQPPMRKASSFPYRIGDLGLPVRI